MRFQVKSNQRLVVETEDEEEAYDFYNIYKRLYAVEQVSLSDNGLVIREHFPTAKLEDFPGADY